jgi:hypothetical protein
MGRFPVSVCIIVTDEGKYLDNALESVKEFAAEVIIVNSPPSHPKSLSQRERDLKDISPVQAEKRTTRTGVKWGRGESYSEVRNLAFEKCTQPWILMMDADCVFDPLSLEELANCIKQTDVSLFYLKQISNRFINEQIIQAILMPIERKEFEEYQTFLAKANEVQIGIKELLEIGEINLKGALFRNGPGIKFQDKDVETLTGTDGLKAEVADIYIIKFNYSGGLKKANEQDKIKLLQDAKYLRTIFKKDTGNFFKTVTINPLNKTGISFREENLADALKFIDELPEKPRIYERYNIVRHSFMKHMYDDNIETLKYCFADLGIEYTTTENELSREHNNILFLPFSTPSFSNYALGFTYIPYQMEQVAFRDDEYFRDDINGLKYSGYLQYLRLLKNAAATWEYSETNIKYLNNLGICNTSYLPFGYHPKMEVLDPDREKTIDVLFYGVLSPRRIQIMDSLAEKGYKTKYIWNLFGRERNFYIERAKIILNMGRFSDAVLEEQRLSFLLNNQRFIISEKPSAKLFLPYQEGIVYSEYAKLAETCEFYLKAENEELRSIIARRGYEVFKENNMTDNLRKVLKST